LLSVIANGASLNRAFYAFGSTTCMLGKMNTFVASKMTMFDGKMIALISLVSNISGAHRTTDDD